ncbi:MAG: ribonuclease inhibitor [Mycetocola sp.]
MPTHIINGAQIAGITDLYIQLNATLMADEDWDMGASLDALNDVLYQHEGAASPDDPVRVVLTDHEIARAALGMAETRRWLEAKREQPGTFNQDRIQHDLNELTNGTGQTYFDLVCEVFADHPDIIFDLR